MLRNAIYVFLISMIPVIELRGAIPAGAALHLPFWLCYILAVIGNMIPVPFILLFVNKVFDWMRKYPKLNKIVVFCETKFAKKAAKAGKATFWTLVGFVAIPLPGTGAWTGSGIAAVLEVPFWKAFLAAFIGVLIAGAIMTAASYGLVSGLSFLL
ncbi:MAG TPA: small multi-drug export protein [Bacillota bacterium]|nr:small multi-drug export protein [Bacillota bacterium]HPE38025.1 small multi-drug export protein [Bacillota bacterium]